jgi:hypothetical protein
MMKVHFFNSAEAAIFLLTKIKINLSLNLNINYHRLNFEVDVFQHMDLMAESLIFLFILFIHCFDLLSEKSISFSFLIKCLY